MLVNRVMPARHLLTVREMVESFAPDLLSVTAVQSRRPDGWWRLGYGELRDWVRSLGTALLAAGVRPGDRVGVISENRSEWVITYLAVTCVGAVIVPFDVLLKAEELGAVMKAAGPVLVFTSTEYLEKVQKAQAIAGSAARLVLFDAHALVDAEWAARSAEASAKGTEAAAAATAEAAKAVPFAGWKTLPFGALVETGRLLRGRGRDLWAGVTVKPKDLAALIFTSGTTGTPKGVMLSHGNSRLERGRRAAEHRAGAHRQLAHRAALPPHVPDHDGPRRAAADEQHHHLRGLDEAERAGAGHEGDAADRRSGHPPADREALQGHPREREGQGRRDARALRRDVPLQPVPVQAAGIRAGRVLFKSVAAQLGLEHLRFFVSGGGPIAKEVIDGMEALGLPTYQGYGLSEHSPVVASCCPPANRPGSVGLPLVNAKVRIAEPDANGNGEILVRGPAVMTGYLGMPEKTAEVLDAEGWLHTGDIGMLDADGYLYITGRLKNIIVTSGGKNIYPEEIENLLAASPLLAEVVVIGKRGAQGGEEPHAIVHPNTDAIAAMEKERGSAFDDEELRKLVGAEIRRCTAGIAAYKAPRTFEVSRDELPKTSSSKVKRFLFADRKYERMTSRWTRTRSSLPAGRPSPRAAA